VRTTRIATHDHGANLAWAGTRLLLLPSPIGDGTVFDSSLRRVGRLRAWSGSYAGVRGRTVYGASFNGYVVAAALPGGRARVVRTLPGQAVYALAAVD
jgi:hypothetical protein